MRALPPRRPGIAARLAFFAVLMVPVTPALAQSSIVSELWREWAVLEKQLRTEKAEVAADRERFEKARAARLGKGGAEKKKGGDRR